MVSFWRVVLQHQNPRTQEPKKNQDLVFGLKGFNSAYCSEAAYLLFLFYRFLLVVVLKNSQHEQDSVANVEQGKSRLDGVVLNRRFFA